MVSVPLRGRQILIRTNSATRSRKRSDTVSVPYRGEVDDMHKGLDVSIYAKPELFPSPREVDKFLYFMQKQFTNTKSYDSFRPLSRQIGSYTLVVNPSTTVDEEFPSPCEVGRVF